MPDTTFTKDESFVMKNLVQMAREKRDAIITPLYEKGSALYQGLNPASGDALTSQEFINVNTVYADTEVLKPALFFRNPKIFITPKSPFFIATRTDPLTGQKQQVKMDGPRAAHTVEIGVNYNFREKNFEKEAKKCVADAILTPMGIIMVGYNTEFGVDEQENEFIKEEDIFFKWQDPRLFLIDPEADCISNARWCGREIFMPMEDFVDNQRYKASVRKEVREGRGLVGFQQTMKTPQAQSVLIDKADSLFREHSSAKRVHLIELWIKPTMEERRKLRKEQQGGKVVVIVQGIDEPAVVDKWPFKMDGFPWAEIVLHPINSEFYGMPSWLPYEQQLIEKNKIRTYQLENAKMHGNLKTYVDKDKVDEEARKRAASGTPEIVEVQGPPGQAVFQPGIPNVSVEFYRVDEKVNKDQENISGISDVKRGALARRAETATQANIQDRSSNTRTDYNRQDVADWIQTIARKVIQLMKQFYDTERIIRVVGSTEIEWSDNFSKSDITDEVDIEVDVATLQPINDPIRQRQALDLLQLSIQAISNPQVLQKLISEGANISLSEMIKELLKTLEIKNERIFQTGQQQSNLAILGQQQGGVGQPISRNTPTMGKELSRANRPLTQGIGQTVR